MLGGSTFKTKFRVHVNPVPDFGTQNTISYDIDITQDGNYINETLTGGKLTKTVTFTKELTKPLDPDQSGNPQNLIIQNTQSYAEFEVELLANDDC